MTKAIFFDWDGTLVDSCAMVLEAHNHVRRQFQMPDWTHGDLFGKSSQSARERYPEVYGDKAEEALEVLYQFVSQRDLSQLPLMQGAETLLSTLSANGYLLGVVSNKRHEFLVEEIKHLKWEPYFGAIVGAGEAVSDKPSPAPLLLAMERLNPELAPKDIIYVGDSETDLLCARNTGASAIYVYKDQPDSRLVNTYDPLYTTSSLSEIGVFLGKRKLASTL